MAGPRILVVDDESVLAGVVVNYLDRAGFDARACGDGGSAVGLVREWQPEVVLLDLGLPGLDGMEVCRRIREFSNCYVIMLTARDEEVDKLDGLAAGADDYVTKPFSVRELVARVQAVLRRPRGALAQEARVLGDLALDLDARAVRVAGDPVELTRTEFDLLQALSERPGAAVTRRQLMDAVWGEGWVGDDHVVDVHVAKIRRKLDPDPARFIGTVRGVGYRLDPGA